MAKRRRLVAGNWKMYGRLTSGLVLARDIVEKAEAAKPLPFDVVICPPATLIWPVSEATMGTPVALGAQDCHTATHGAYTGDLGAAMFTDLGCKYVILGHSERRGQHGETNELIARKVEAAQLSGLNVILCVGETAAQLETGNATDIVVAQLKASMPEKCKMAQLVVAYEPVWAIGSGQQPAPEDVIEIIGAIRRSLGPTGEVVRILYGGSVTPSNAAPMMQHEEIDGFLVGSASLNAEGFWAIAEKCG